ncbi:O-antigen ligase family protein [Sphingobacterium sp. BIGb0116]|uniref:O-antigen ligase family protein n=1 Tax=Sphingobacterium sp. BIGb0116 TaxID=2940619 RepID=UPI0021693E15|nr:O-antigen ligase family protein [Sphingobacterium sp. BIGb0116]MCS4162957.1 tetratricopeptide (TPR) repeat protein [Sphingobacterium sp. BIGb0116]
MISNKNWIEILKIALFPAIIFLLASIFSSRSFALGAITSFFFILFRSKAKLKPTLWLSILILIASITIAFITKIDSSLGRILIYKISFKAFLVNPIEGIGWNGIYGKYLYLQSCYFSERPFSEKELLLADNTHYVFNEYYRLVIENGILMLIPLFFFFFFSLKAVNRALDINNNFLTYFLSTAYITIIIASFFTNTISRDLIWLVVVVQLYLNIITIEKFSRKNLMLFNILLFLVIICLSINYNLTRKYFLNLKQQAQSGEFTDTDIELMRSKTAFLSTDFEVEKLKIISNYYTESMQWEKAFEATLNLSKLKPFNVIYSRLGMICAHLGNNVEAEKYYKSAVYSVPNRFSTRLELFNFYLENNEIELAKKSGLELLNLPIKVNSVDVINIRKYVKSKILDL